jgi:hypothetical protein
MATQETPDAFCPTTHKTVGHDALEKILRARRCKSAMAGCYPAEDPLIGTDESGDERYVNTLRHCD